MAVNCEKIEETNWSTYTFKGTGDIYKRTLYCSSNKYIVIQLDGIFDKICNESFSNSKIKTIIIRHEAFKHVADNCFRSSSLENISLPESLESIGHNNFCGKFTSFNIPSKIQDFPADNLKDCDNLAQISVSDGNQSYKVVDGVLYNYNLTVAVFCPNAKTGNIILLDSVKHIGEYCFYGCKSLNKVIIPTSVESIGDYAFEKASLKKLVIPNSVKAIGVGCFKDAHFSEYLKLSNQICVLPDEVFKNSEIYKPLFSYRDVIEISKEAFGIRTDTLPSFVSFESLKNLGTSAFNNCSLTPVCFEFFSCLENIDKDAFKNTNANVKLRYFSSCPIKLSTNAFRGLSENATLIVPKGSKRIFQNAAPWSSISNIEERDLDVDLNDEGEVIKISDEIHLKRLRSVANSKINADRIFLKEILEDLYLNYLYVESEEEYSEALEIINYNRSFAPAIIPDLEQKMCHNWANRYKLRLVGNTVLNSPVSYVASGDERVTVSFPTVDTMALPAMDIHPLFSEKDTTSLQVFFNEDIQGKLQNILSQAKNSIKIAVSWFTNYGIFKQIKEIASSGIKVQLITNNDLINNGGYCLNLNELINAGVEISLVEYPHLLHHKFCIIDNDIVVNGSYNWTRFSLKNYENITVIYKDIEAINAFTEEFANLLQNAEHQCIKEMPEFVSERSEYDRSAFRQYVTEELDAEARETSEERDKITKLQKAASLNMEYLEKINPEAKKKYAKAFDTVKESVSMQNAIAAMVEDKPIIASHAPIDTPTETYNSATVNTTNSQSANNNSAIESSSIVTRETHQTVEKVKASGLFMVLDVSGSMGDTYKAGHVHSISKKALSASLAITDSKEVSLWTFGHNAQFVSNVGIDTIKIIDGVHCKTESTNLIKFVEAADSAIEDNALVIIFTDDDSSSISTAISAMQKRSNVFWQIIVYGVSHNNITNAISNISNTSVVSLTDYASRTDDEIRQILLKDYVNWKKNQNSGN